MSSQVLASGTNFLMTVVVVRDVGIEQFGFFSLCFLMLTVSRSFLNSTVLLPTSAIAPKLHDVSLARYRAFLLLNVSGFCAVSSCILVGWLWLTAATMPSIDPSGVAQPLVLCNIALCFGDFFRRFYFVNEAYIRGVSVDVVRYCAQIVIVLSAFIFFPGMLTPEVSLYMIAAASSLACILGGLRYGKCSWSRRFIVRIWPRHRNFILFMLPSATLEVLQGPGVFFFAGPFIGEAMVGAVRAIQNVANTLNLPFNALQQIAPSMAGRASRSGGPERLKKLLMQIGFFAVVVSLFISSLMLLMSGFLIEGLLGLELDSFWNVLLLFCLANIISAGRLPLSVRSQTLELPKELFVASIVSSACSIAVAYFVTTLGVIAIPAARVAGESFYAFVLLMFVAVRRLSSRAE